MEGNIPKGWICPNLNEVCQVLDNQRRPINSTDRQKRQGTIPYYGATGVIDHIDDYIFDEELLLLGEDGAPFFDKKKEVAFLIESKQKKNAFLTDTLRKLDLSQRGRIIDRQFEEVKEDDFSFVTCRALDKFTEKLPRIVKWSGMRKKILFGGPTLEEALNSLKLGFEKKLIPMSERRYIFIVE